MRHELFHPKALSSEAIPSVVMYAMVSTLASNPTMIYQVLATNLKIYRLALEDPPPMTIYSKGDPESRT